MRMINIIRRGVIPALLCMLAADQGVACPNPVFQYALDNWYADLYQVVARGADSWPADQSAALRLLRDAERSGSANLQVRLEPTATNATAPLLEVNYVDARGIKTVVWSGTPDAEIARSLLNSPTRTKIADLLLQRKTAVWVLLESGNRSKDNEAARIIQDELHRMESVLTTSTPQFEGGMGWGGGPPTESPPISFGFLRLQRNDPAEAMLVRMLLKSKPDLEKADNETMAFPIYGKGLILDALVGKAIEPQRIWAVAEFLTGPCSCVFKDAWHGASLLLKVNWDGGSEALKDTTATAGGAPVGAGAFLRRMEQGATNSVATKAPPEKGKSKE